MSDVIGQCPRCGRALTATHKCGREKGESSLAEAKGSAALAAKQLGLKSEYAAFLKACDDARKLAQTWREHATKIDAGDLRLGLESCALDLDRMAEAWALPNNKVRNGE